VDRVDNAGEHGKKRGKIAVSHSNLSLKHRKRRTRWKPAMRLRQNKAKRTSLRTEERGGYLEH